MPPYSQNLQR